jgi:alkaline phosphatase D
VPLAASTRTALCPASSFVLWIALRCSAAALPVPLVNPSGEINNGVDRTAIPHPTFPGWQGANGQSIRGGTHGGNGAWRISVSPGGDVRQRGTRLISAGAAFSLRFDAAPFGGLPPAVTAEFYTEPTPGSVNVLLSKVFSFTTPLTSGSWEGFQLLSTFGEFDAAAGQAIGVRFRNTSGSGIFLSVDNIRLEAFDGPASASTFATSWTNTPARPWAGPDFWANRLQDWEVSAGRLQTRLIPTPRPLRTVHRLTTAVREEPGDFALSVRTGLASATWTSGALSGIFLGAGASHDHRGAALMHHRGGRDGGLFLGVNSLGRAVIQDNRLLAFTQLALGNQPAAVPSSSRIAVTATWQPATRNYLLAVQVRDGVSDALLSNASVTVEPYTVLGNFGLFSHPASGDARFWFDDFTGSGSKLQNLPERALGPVISTQYTLSRGVLKLTAQLAPVAVAGAPAVLLEIDPGSGWQTAASATIDPDACTASFRIPVWAHTGPVPFRVGFAENGTTLYRSGIIQADPVDQPEIVVAGLTCMIHCAADSANDGFNGIDETGGGAVSWTRDRINFPHEDVVASLALQQPDLYAFTGDQVYEGGSPTTQDSSTDENRRLDYLYKWYLHCWTWRDLIDDRPSIAIPDDHDVFQGNLWGEGGKASATQEAGGYTKPAAFVRMVERTQTSHLPDPFDPTPVTQNIGVYYTSWVYGRIGFAIFEDRKFKNGYSDEGFGTITTTSPTDNTARFNRTNLDLLGSRQEAFLDAFAADWAGQDMKAAISQSPLASSSTHSGAGYTRRYYDLDANGWPQNKRDKAVGLLRKSFSPHINGDQHVAVMLQHGISAQRDAVYSFCVPSIANAFSRSWNPANSASGISATVSSYTGPYLDGFGNRIHVLAAANPAHYYGTTTSQGTPLLHDRGPGYGIIRFNKPERTTTFECWPLHAGPTRGAQYPGWPLTIRQTDNDGRVPAAYLPVVDTATTRNPVVRVTDESTGELVYGYRVNGTRFRPPVFLTGRTYRVEVVAADGLAPQVATGVAATAMPAHAIARFDGASRYLIRGRSFRLAWDCPSAASISIAPGIGDVTTRSLHGIGHIDTVPLSDTTWTLTSTPASGPALQAQVSVRVFPTHAEWRSAKFLPADLADPAKETTLWGDAADPDRDGLTNGEEYAAQTDPLSGQSTDVLRSGLSELVVSSSSGQYVVHTLRELLPGAGYEYVAQWSDGLDTWHHVPWPDLVEVSRVPGAAGETDRITVRMPESIVQAATVTPQRFYRILLRPVAP